MTAKIYDFSKEKSKRKSTSTYVDEPAVVSEKDIELFKKLYEQSRKKPKLAPWVIFHSNPIGPPLDYFAYFTEWTAS